MSAVGDLIFIEKIDFFMGMNCLYTIQHYKAPTNNVRLFYCGALCTAAGT